VSFKQGLVNKKQNKSEMPVPVAHSLRHKSAASRLLKLRVRIPPGAWMFFCRKCCQVEVSATSLSPDQRDHTYCGASLCDLETSRLRRTWSALGRGAMEGKNRSQRMSVQETGLPTW